MNEKSDEEMSSVSILGEAIAKKNREERIGKMIASGSSWERITKAVGDPGLSFETIFGIWHCLMN